MTILRPTTWSLWSVPERGLLLICDDTPGVLVQEVTIAVESDGSFIAASKSPTKGKTLLEGDSEHPDRFELVLSEHLAIFGIERTAVERVDVEDVVPVIAAPFRRPGIQ